MFSLTVSVDVKHYVCLLCPGLEGGITKKQTGMEKKNRKKSPEGGYLRSGCHPMCLGTRVMGCAIVTRP